MSGFDFTPSEPRCSCGSMNWMPLPSTEEHRACPRFAQWPREKDQRGGMGMHDYGNGPHKVCFYCRRTWVPDGSTLDLAGAR